MGNWCLSVALALLAIASPSAWADSAQTDSHFVSPNLRVICRDSAFVHGYLHGYEEGFHIADLRLYAPGLSFNPPEVGKKDVKAYRSEFGNKNFFRAGYRYGFQNGYADGISGRAFRALGRIRDSLGQQSFPATAESDRALALGYIAGRKQGLRDGRLREPFRPNGSSCDPQQERSSPEFCQVLKQGYHMGYIDGYENQHDSANIQTASR
jgi:hypothetical protein